MLFGAEQNLSQSHGKLTIVELERNVKKKISTRNEKIRGLTRERIETEGKVYRIGNTIGAVTNSGNEDATNRFFEISSKFFARYFRS